MLPRDTAPRSLLPAPLEHRKPAGYGEDQRQSPERDREGRCRLQSSWGEVFVDQFYTSIEKKVPFIDNLYPQSAAMLWAVRDNPDPQRDLGQRFQPPAYDTSVSSLSQSSGTRRPGGYSAGF